MRILYVALKWDYGDPARGLSFEHWNFFDPLVRMGHDVIYFDFGTLHKTLGHEAMNSRLIEVVRVEKPDLLFCVLFENEIDPAVMRRISEESGTITVNWFCDDHWRFENFSRHWAPSFNYVVTTATSALRKYAAMGYGNVIKSQWACNHWLYRPLDLPFVHDVSFVGQPHGSRRALIEHLAAVGIRVALWGYGWGNGRVDQDEMIRIFNQSRINLNLSNASSSGSNFVAECAPFSPRFARFGRFVPGPARTLLKRLTSPQQRVTPTAQTEQLPDQIKGRNFELPGCAAFQLSGAAEDLASYFIPDKEVVVFTDFDDLVSKIRYYLAREDERKAIALAGYERTRREHTWVHRFTDIFRRVGLDTPAAESYIGTVRSGSVIEI